MINLILADYYEEKGFVKKSQRLKRRSKTLMLYGYYGQYNDDLDLNCSYGYEEGNGWFMYGCGDGYKKANGWYYRW